MCSVPFGLVALFGRVAALNHGALGGIARLRRVARLGSIARLGGVDLGRRGRIGPNDLALGRAVAALHDLGLNVALLDRRLDHGRRVDDGGRVGQLRLSFFLVLLV